MIEKISLVRNKYICSRLKIIFLNLDLIKLVVAIFKLAVNKIMLFLLNQKNNFLIV